MNRNVKIFIIGISLLLLCANGRTQGQESFISLFADSSRQFDAYCIFEGDHCIIELWVYCYPSVRGQTGAEFRIDYPINVIASAPIVNEEIISFHSGDLSTGVNVLYEECQWDINWCFHQFLVLNSHELTLIDIIPYRFRNCEAEYVHEPVNKWMELYLNYEDESTTWPRKCKPPLWVYTGTHITSWGVIKAFLKMSDE